MNKRAFLLFLLLTPLIVIVSSTLAFRLGFGPEATKNNGIFFSEFTDISEMQISSLDDVSLDFADGKWVMGIYHNEEGRTLENSKLMKQLNVALNRDINRVKRILIFEETPKESFFENIKNDFPRQEIFVDSDSEFKDLLLDVAGGAVTSSSYIFIIDPYGRLVMYFPNDLTPKKILKDLKVLI
tara:strand:- start:2099 stop:2650 length:552 start_codon:yes stop_codon:yes gene_type:complete